METVTEFILGGSKITADGDCSHEIKRCLLLGKKVMTNLDGIFKSRDITLPTKVRLVKAMVFPVVMYGSVTSLAPHERLPEILVVPREKTPTGAAARHSPEPRQPQTPMPVEAGLP